MTRTTPASRRREEGLCREHLSDEGLEHLSDEGPAEGAGRLEGDLAPVNGRVSSLTARQRQQQRCVRLPGIPSHSDCLTLSHDHGVIPRRGRDCCFMLTAPMRSGDGTAAEPPPPSSGMSTQLTCGSKGY